MKKVIIILLLFAFLLCATKGFSAVQSYHIDSSAGGGGDGSFSNPFNELSDIGSSQWSQIASWIAAGDDVEIRLKCGSSFEYISPGWLIGASGNSSHYVKVTSYDSGSKPKLWRSSISSGALVYGERHDYLWFDNIEFEGAQYGFRDYKYGESQGGSSNLKFTKCLFDNTGKQGIEIRDLGGHIIGGSLGEGNTFYNIGYSASSAEAGVIMSGNSHGEISYNEFYGVKAQLDGGDGIMVDGCWLTLPDKILIHHNYFHDLYKDQSDDGNGVNIKDSRYVYVYKNKILDNKNWGVSIQNDSQYIHVYENRIGRNGYYVHDGVTPKYNDGIGVLDSDEDSDPGTKYIFIYSNLIFSNTKSGITVQYVNSGDIVSDVTIVNNTIVANGVAHGGDSTTPKNYYCGIYINIGSNYIIKNNIFYNNRPADSTNPYRQMVLDGSRNWTVEDNVFFDKRGTADIYYINQNVDPTTIGSGNIIADPNMIDPDNYDYRLNGGSICIDKAQKYLFDNGIDPDKTDWTPSLPIVESLNHDDCGIGYECGAYAFVVRYTTINSSPANGTENVSLTPTLTIVATKNKTDPNNNWQVGKVRFRIDDSADMSSPIHEYDASSISYSVPSGILSQDTQYYWDAQTWAKHESAPALIADGVSTITSFNTYAGVNIMPPTLKEIYEMMGI